MPVARFTGRRTARHGGALQGAPPALRSRMTALMILAISVVGFAGGPALVGWLSQYVVGEVRFSVRGSPPA